ncbi:MAG: UDP-N-acetylmuramoyl-tripeptide--D-alanyl-D-alanine ligase [Thermodesulfobacteriota bacterium]|nr:UDP-N-acetylmuramoyl-tripeptide--D-alanyl-D-alanine ligase [Thermodesulfobacteriota bacterium]
MNLSLSDLSDAVCAYGDLGPFEDAVASGVAIDSRLVKPGEVFACLPGENFDGHAFALKAVSRGACAVLAERPLPELEGKAPVLMVPNTLEALGRLGAYFRQKAGAHVTAVTGSAGKTTAKEMLADILSRLGPTGRNYKNFNNLLGVPLSMLKFSGLEKFWVLELGVSLPGEMDGLGSMVLPDLAVILNIGPAHLEGLSDMRGVAQAKASLLRYLAPEGRALVSMDYPLLWEEALKIVPHAIGFSCREKAAPYQGRYLGSDENGLGRFSLELSGSRLELSLPFCGEYFAENVLAAAAAAHLLGADLEQIRRGFEKSACLEQRFHCRDMGSLLLIDDTYNANPLSMVRSLEAAVELAKDRPLILVLGDMMELGPGAHEAHRELGRRIAKTPCGTVFFHGEFAKDVALGLGNGNWPGRFMQTTGPEAFAGTWKDLGVASGVVLFKGSRSMKMEEYVSALTREFEAGCGP